MKNILYILISVLLLPCAAYAQREERPEWATGDNAILFKSKSSYIERIVVKTEVTRDAMRKKAREILVDNRRLATGERVVFSDGETARQSGLTVTAQPYKEYIDDYNEIGYFLFQIKNPSDKYDNIDYTDKYSFSARVFVPGMAQIYKGSKGKGIFFIAGETALVGGIVIAESLRASNESKIGSTHSDKQVYIDNADMCENVRNGLIAGAVALYAWNVIDGWVAKGKKHFEVLGNAELRVMPYVIPNAGSGLTLSLNF